jgi:hypothetical protein
MNTKNLDFIIERDYSWESITNKNYVAHSYTTPEKRVELSHYISMMLSPEYRNTQHRVFMAAKRELEAMDSSIQIIW